MTIIIKNIISFSLGIVLLVSMSGFRIISHYCEKSGYEKAIVLSEVDDNNQNKNTNCNTDCIDCDIEETDNYQEDRLGDCCKTIEKQVLLKVEFDLLKNTQKIEPIISLLFEKFSIFNDSEIELNISLVNNEGVFRPPTDKFLLVYLNKLRTEPYTHC